MKKKIAVIALAAFAIVGTAAYLHTQTATHSHSDEGILQCNQPCSYCKGTGWWHPGGSTTQTVNCPYCRGTGRNGSY